MKNMMPLILLAYIFSACSEKKVEHTDDLIVANGQMPNITTDKQNTIHLVYGSGDSILYSYSSGHGNSFSKPQLIAVVPHVYTFATRGPQIAATATGLVVTACTADGDIYSFYKAAGSKWTQGQQVNDEDTIAKEGLMALSADADNVFAVWLDLRGNKHNKIYGAGSPDGGKTWSANKLVYASPDTTVCGCCKPSVVVKENKVYVMFRNWLNGNRDMYLIQSPDGGNTFLQAKKLGTGNWKLNGCPMDGGGLAVTGKGQIETVWRREGKIYTSTLDSAEKEIGEGKGCTIETAGNKNMYAWTENGQVVVVNSQGQKKILGKGSGPVLKLLRGKNDMICVWEHDKQIHASVLGL